MLSAVAPASAEDSEPRVGRYLFGRPDGPERPLGSLGEAAMALDRAVHLLVQE